MFKNIQDFNTEMDLVLRQLQNLETDILPLALMKNASGFHLVGEDIKNLLVGKWVKETLYSIEVCPQSTDAVIGVVCMRGCKSDPNLLSDDCVTYSVDDNGKLKIYGFLVNIAKNKLYVERPVVNPTNLPVVLLDTTDKEDDGFYGYISTYPKKLRQEYDGDDNGEAFYDLAPCTLLAREKPRALKVIDGRLIDVNSRLTDRKYTYFRKLLTERVLTTKYEYLNREFAKSISKVVVDKYNKTEDMQDESLKLSVNILRLDVTSDFSMSSYINPSFTSSFDYKAVNKVVAVVPAKFKDMEDDIIESIKGLQFKKESGRSSDIFIIFTNSDSIAKRKEGNVTLIDDKADNVNIYELFKPRATKKEAAAPKKKVLKFK